MDDYKEGSWWEEVAEVEEKQEERSEPERFEAEPVMSDRCGVTLEYVIALMEKKRALAAYAS